MNRFSLLCLSMLMLIAVVGSSSVSIGDELSACLPSCSGVVDKAPGCAFTVEIMFKNIGSSEDTWSVNIAFEGENWFWSGAPQNLTLKPSCSKTLIWYGTVPVNATVGSVARLVVYYDDFHKALDWWIHVVPNSELSITSSIVR